MKKKPQRADIYLFSVLLLIAGCDGENGTQEADGDAADAADVQEATDIVDSTEEVMDVQDIDASDETGEDVQEEDYEEEEIPPPPPKAFTANTAYDYSSGSYSVISLDDLAVEQDIMSIHADSVVVCTGGMPLVLERYGADTLTILDHDSPYAVVNQFSVESGTNPLDIELIASGEGVVTRNNVTTAAIVNLEDGTMDTLSLDMEDFADGDGIPEMGALSVAEGKIFIALQLLDRDTAFWDPTGPGLVVVFDEDTLELIDTDTSTTEVDAVALTGANPQPRFRASPDDAQVLFIAEVGFYGQLDGGIEGVNAVTYDTTGFVVTEETLGGDIAAWVIAGGSVGFAAVNKPEFAGDKLVKFDPSDGTLIRDNIIERDAFTLTGMALAGDGRLLVVDRTLESSGVLVIDVETGDPITDEPVYTGIAPFSICVL